MNPMDPSDRELVELVIEQGDERAFRVLYRRHTPAANAFVSRLLGGSASEAEDVLQDAWLRAVRALPDFRWRSSFRTWLMGIALNGVRGVMRKRQRSREVSLQADREAAAKASRSDPVGGLDLERAIAELPDGYRTVLVLHDLYGFTHVEIGAELGITPGASRSQLFHGRRAARALLGPSYAEGRAAQGTDRTSESIERAGNG